jgi:hypothetical protein
MFQRHLTVCASSAAIAGNGFHHGFGTTAVYMVKTFIPEDGMVGKVTLLTP